MMASISLEFTIEELLNVSNESLHVELTTLTAVMMDGEFSRSSDMNHEGADADHGLRAGISL